MKTTNWLPRLTIALLAGFLMVLHIQLYQYAYDDAYIHFRVAHNLLENGSPDFNTNEMVKVSTSSGWTVFLTLLLGIARLFKIENHFPLVISIINALISLCGMLVYTKVIEILQSHELSLSSKLLFQIPFIALLMPSSIGLMETPLALLIAGLGIYCLLRSKPSGFALLGFAAYIRLELLILLALAIFAVVLQKQFGYQSIMGYIGIGTIPLLIYDLYFFHTVIPYSMVAKSTVYSITWFDSAGSILFFSLPPIAYHNTSIMISGILFSGILLFTQVRTFREQRGLNSFWHKVFCLWSLLIIGGYTLGHAQIFGWYIPLYTIPIWVACFLCFTSNKYPRNLITKSLVSVLFLVSAISAIKTIYASVGNPSAFGYFAGGSRVKVYLSIGAILYEEYPHATLLTSEIGGLGYSFRGKILDAAGLASPDALGFHPMKIPEQRANGAIGAIPPGYVKASMPDLIVSYDYFAQALLSNNVVQQYNVILIPAYLPEDAIYSERKTIWGSQYLRVYIRKDLPIPEKVYALGQ